MLNGSLRTTTAASPISSRHNLCLREAMVATFLRALFSSSTRELVLGLEDFSGLQTFLKRIT
jgi:hypothetical protein